MNEELNSYIASLVEDTQMVMEEFQTPEMAFTSTVLDQIEDLLDCTDIVKEHCLLTKSNGSVRGEIHAYSESTNGEVLYLFYTFYNPRPEIETKSYTSSKDTINRPQGFYNAAVKCIFDSLDSSSSEYKAAKFIYDNAHKYHSVKLIVLSNYVIKTSGFDNFKVTIATKPVYLDIWDINKIYGNTHSLKDHVAIDIDFDTEEYSRYKIPFLQMESAQFGYKCIQAMFPAKLLYQLYEKYNTNLLLNNVRYFLGLKGTKDKKPNVAMLDTLRKENEKFLAYNNGITALAQGIESLGIGDKTDVTDPDSTIASQYISMGVLKKILDFRIINGGQTTAVIYNAKKNSKDNPADPSKKVNLLGVYVQVKLIISEDIDKMASSIALSSNFQNKVKTSEFTASNTFNKKMEDLSRSVKVPNSNNDIKFWFYERLKGQYDEKRSEKKTGVERELFENQNPKKMKFSKEDVAKIWSNWNQSPFDSVKGANTTYVSFMKKMVESSIIPDELYYKKTIALIIIYKFLMARPENKGYANGKATVVAYAIAMLQYLTMGRFDLIKVWDNQGLSDNAKIFMNALCDKIYHLLNIQVQVLGTSILSYGKTQKAYEFITKQPMGLNIHLLDDDKI